MALDSPVVSLDSLGTGFSFLMWLTEVSPSFDIECGGVGVTLSKLKGISTDLCPHPESSCRVLCWRKGRGDTSIRGLFTAHIPVELTKSRPGSKWRFTVKKDVKNVWNIKFMNAVLCMRTCNSLQERRLISLLTSLLLILPPSQIQNALSLMFTCSNFSLSSDVKSYQ